jgi:hypothetical protein
LDLQECGTAHPKKVTEAYLGFMVVIFSPFLDLTHSLLIKRPIGWVYLRALGAVSSMDKSDIFRLEEEQ